MSNYDAKLITAKAQAQVLAVVKHAIDTVDTKASAAIPKLLLAVENDVPVLKADGSLVDSGLKVGDIQRKISPSVDGNIVTTDANGFVKNSGFKPSDFQKLDAMLTSLAAIANSEGLLALNGTESVIARKILDGDISATEGLFFALKAFINKNGSIVMPQGMAILNGTTGKVILNDNGSAVVVGDGVESVILKADLVGGVPQIFAGSVDPLTRIPTKAEMDAYVSDRLTQDSDYKGIFTYYASESTIVAAKALIEALDASKFVVGTITTALIFGDTGKEILKGTYVGTAWTWTDDTPFYTGDWIYFAHIINAAHPLQDAGRAVFKEDATSKAFETMLDMTQIPDGIWLTVGGDGRLTVTGSTIKGGTVNVPKAFGAWNLKVDDNTTIQDALDAKINKLSILTTEPTVNSTDSQVVSAKAIFTTLGAKGDLNTDVKDNHVVAINEINNKGKANANDILDLKNLKLDKLVDMETVNIGNITMVKDKAGNIQDSGVKVARISELEATKITKVAAPTVGAITTLDAAGALVNGQTLLVEVDQVIAEAVRVQDIITDADIAQLIKDIFG